MNYVFIVICVGLFVVLIQLLMTYQKRAHDLRLKQEPVRRRIRIHKQAMVEAITGMHTAADLRLEELVEEAEKYKEVVSDSGRLLDEWGRRVEEELEEEEEDQEEEPEEFEDRGGDILETKEAELSVRDLMRKGTRMQEELNNQSSGLYRDIDTVRRTLTRLDAKLQRTGASLPAGQNSQKSDG